MAACQGGLAVAGLIDSVGTEAGAVGYWDGESWLGMTDEQISCSGISQRGNEALIFNDEIYVSVVTSSSGGVELGGVGRWTAGRWESLEGGMDLDTIAVWGAAGAWHTGGPSHRVRTMAEHDGDLSIGGDFTAAFEIEARHVARRDGSTWTTPGDLDAPAVWIPASSSAGRRP